MTNTDKLFIEMCNDILENGTTNLGQKVRPVWEDGTPAYTKKIFGVINRYDLRKEFPALTLRRTAIKSAVDEILWIYQKKSNNIHELNSHIWDQWADETGSVGKAYGYQAGLKNIQRNILEDDNQYHLKMIDQVESVLYDLKHEPFSRRMILNLFNFADLHEMHLQPCCWSCTFNVSDEGGNKPVLNMILNQRSNDVLVANNWNVVQYASLLMMFAQVSNMIPGELVHVIADAHIYDRHFDIVKEVISRPSTNITPIVTIDPDIKDFKDFTVKSFNIERYAFNPKSVGKIPVAI